jgi:hypothetical protein
MKAARDMHRHDRETHRERCRGDPWPGDFHHHEADDRSHQVPADERARLRRRDLRQAHHQDDRCCEWDEQEGMAEPSARSSIAAMAIAAPVAPATTATMRRVPGVVSDKAANAARDFIRVTPKEKGGGPQGAAAR